MATTKPLYCCPVCRRKFTKQKQAHSCLAVAVDAHFRGKPAELRDLFDHLCGKLRKLGPLRVDAVQTSINLIPKHHMGGVRVLRDRLRVAFLLNHRAEAAGIERIDRITPNAYLHVAYVARKTDLTSGLLLLLKEAFARASRRD
jgi:hypothetical protein